MPGDVQHLFPEGVDEHARRDPAHVVEVDRRAHQRPGDEERFGGVDTAFAQRDARFGEDRAPDQPVRVDRPVGHAGVVGVPHQVVHPVDVEAPVDDACEAVLACDDGADLGRVDPLRLEDVGDRSLPDETVDLVVASPDELLHHRFGDVGERPVADVVEEGGRRDEFRLAVVKPELPAHEACKVHRPERVLKPGVVCARVDEVCKPELGDVAEPLDDSRVEQPEHRFVRLDVAVHRILDDLHQFN